MINFLRNNRIAMWLLTLLRIYIGFEWIMISLNKITGGEAFSASGLIISALNSGNSPAWFTNFLHLTTIGGENTIFFDAVIPWAQLLIGIALVFGIFTLGASFAGLMMNTSFILAGVISDNPTFIVIQIFILVAGFNAGKVGLDFWITPWIRNKVNILQNSQLKNR